MLWYSVHVESIRGGGEADRGCLVGLSRKSSIERLPRPLVQALEIDNREEHYLVNRKKVLVEGNALGLTSMKSFRFNSRLSFVNSIHSRSTSQYLEDG
jgi:hypothetical protein